ncbi:MAG: tRNA threonylcarbamoyladenosine dehydratase [Candidatus Riflebacteria bacterium]|nr:tRNA threonylcarbamoyladenosine dehydratase [Candidatus Riflebacteria bacterium]
MYQTSVPKKFDRNARLWGRHGVERLALCHVMVLGMGGVGSFAVEGLTRAGVNRLTLVDFDDVCITNVNRQLHALPSTIGKSKSALMADRVKSINPAATVEAIHGFYESKSSAEMLARSPDLIVDCIDNVTAKLHLLATCIHQQIPIVTCLGASGKVDPTRVGYDELRKTKDDPLAKTIRKNLWRKYNINLQRVDNLMAVYSSEDIILPDPGYQSSLCGSECVCPNSSNQHHTCAKRNIIYGSAVFVTSMFGMTAASLAVRFLSGVSPLSLVPTLKILPGDDPLKNPAEE